MRMTAAERARVAASRGAAAREARPCILVDTREQTPLKFSDAVDAEVVTLPAGDYSLRGFTDTVAIERKSAADFVACVGPERERFLEQCERLASYPTRALVIEATWEEFSAGAYRSNTNPQSVTGTLLAIMADYRLPVLLAGDEAGAAEAVERMLVRLSTQRRRSPQ